MKRAPLLVLAGTVAGFIGVLGFHTRSAALASPAPGASGQHPGRPDDTGRHTAGPGAVRSAVGAERAVRLRGAGRARSR